MATKVRNVRLSIDNSKVVVSKLEIDVQDNMNKTVVLADDDDDDETPRNLDLVETSKFLAESYGDWEFVVYLSNMKDFKSREEFDEWALRENLRENQEESVEKISFEEALHKLGVEFSLNTNYYLNQPDEIEKDLNRKLTNSENLINKFPEKELFYKQLCKLFGEKNSSMTTEFDYILEDFNFLENTGNTRTATAKQGEYYLIFEYYTS